MPVIHSNLKEGGEKSRIFVFQWSNGQSGPEAGNLATGAHTAAITNASGCHLEFPAFIPAGFFEPDLSISRPGDTLTQR